MRCFLANSTQRIDGFRGIDRSFVRYLAVVPRMRELRNLTLMFGAIAAASLLPRAAHSDTLVRVTGQVRDSASDAAIASRLYIRGKDGTWYFPNSTDLRDVVRYKRKNYWDENQVEMHATLSAKPFEVELPAGEYAVVIERGKEYLPLKTKLAVDQSHTQWQLRPRGGSTWQRVVGTPVTCIAIDHWKSWPI